MRTRPTWGVVSSVLTNMGVPCVASCPQRRTKTLLTTTRTAKAMARPRWPVAYRAATAERDWPTACPHAPVTQCRQGAQLQQEREREVGPMKGLADHRSSAALLSALSHFFRPVCSLALL